MEGESGIVTVETNYRPILVKGRWLKIATVVDEAWSNNEISDPDLYLKMLRNNSGGIKADIFTFTQKPPNTRIMYSYSHEPESVAALCFGSFKEWWEGLPQETRKNVRRSQKRGVTVKIGQFDDQTVRGIVELNNESPVRQGRAFAHYGKTFDEVKNDYSAFLERSDLVCAYSGDELIGISKIVYRGEIASILQLLVKLSHSDKRPSNAILAKVVELCESKKIYCITYGLFTYGNKRTSPLQEFKTRNGFAEMLIPRYNVPLTRWGTLCIKLKMHRGLSGILPDSVLQIALKARGKWYRLKQVYTRPV
jgi:hypothetical protein